VPDQICGGAQNSAQPSAEFSGEKDLYLSDGQFVGRPVIMAELIVDDLRAYGISVGTGASSSATVRKNAETTGCAL
jgi:hypothetical protein